MREALADQAAEGRVVTRAAADHDRDLALRRGGRAGDAAGDATDVAAVGRDEPSIISSAKSSGRLCSGSSPPSAGASASAASGADLERRRRVGRGVAVRDLHAAAAGGVISEDRREEHESADDEHGHLVAAGPVVHRTRDERAR